MIDYSVTPGSLNLGNEEDLERLVRACQGLTRTQVDRKIALYRAARLQKLRAAMDANALDYDPVSHRVEYVVINYTIANDGKGRLQTIETAKSEGFELREEENLEHGSIRLVFHKWQ